MRLFIRLENGNPVDHPIMEDNFVQAFPDIDIDNLPENFACFERVLEPVPGRYEVVEGPKYGFVDGVYKDVWTVRAMTEAEKEIKNQAVLANIYRYRDFVKSEAEMHLSSITEQSVRDEWIEYIYKLNSFVPVDLDASNFPIPPFGGSTKVTGSPPDVTG